MELTTGITVKKTTHSKLSEVDFDNLPFGKYVSDHMLVADYANGEWQPAEIVPYGNLIVSPTTLAFHYGQTVFEGMKAFINADGRINIFRIDTHHERLAKSLDRMCMAVPPKEMFVEGLIKLLQADKAWIPTKSGDGLYIRPFVFASEAKFGVKVSDEYKFVIFTGPVGPAFAKPIKVKVETDYARAAKGGTGFAKCGGNYGGAFYPTQLARQQGYDQVLWTDAQTHEYIEESGMMNAMFVIDGKLVTPPLSDSILDGVTRDSLLAVAVDLGYTVEERPVSIAELEKAFADNKITEAFGAGTAAVVAPIGTIHINGIDYALPAYTEESIQNKLKNDFELVRTGKKPDLHNWNFLV